MILPCVASLQQASAPTEDVDRGDHSEEASDSDSDSLSNTESCSDFGSHSESGSVWEGLLHRCQIHTPES